MTADDVDLPLKPRIGGWLDAGESRWSAAAVIAVLWLTAVVLLWRRVAGALSVPLDFPAMTALAVVAVGLAITVRLLRRPSVFGPLDSATSVSVPLVVLAAAASLPETPPLALALLWTAVAAEELWAWGVGIWRKGSILRAPAPPSDRADAAQQQIADAGDSLGNEHGGGKIPSADVVQQMTRSRSADGSEAITGWLRIPLAAGQRSANVHLAFCPPLPKTPRVEMLQRDGPAARIRPVQIFPYGARFDLKLAQVCPAETTIALRFVAVSAVKDEDVGINAES